LTVGERLVFTVNNKVAVAFEHPPDPDTIYVIVDVPALKPETAPVDASIVATVGVPLLHVPPVIVELNDEVPPTHIVCVPDKVPAFGGACSVTVTVAVAFEQPPVPVTV
jgi:hypothetical protein